MHLATLASELPPPPSGPFTPLEWYAIVITGVAALFIAKWAIPRYIKETAREGKSTKTNTPVPPPPTNQPSITALHAIVTSHIETEETDRREWKNSLDNLRNRIDQKFDETRNAVHQLLTAFAVAQEKHDQLARRVDTHGEWLSEQTGRFDVPTEHPPMPPRSRRNTPTPRR